MLCLSSFELYSRWVPLASAWSAQISQLSRREATRKLGAELKFQRRSCKLSFLLPPYRQSAPESLLAGYLQLFIPLISGE